MLPAAKGCRRRRTFLRSFRYALNAAAALGIAPYSLRGQDIVLVTWRLPYHIFSASIVPLLGAYCLIIPNPIFAISFFPVVVFSIEFFPSIFSMVVVLICNIVYRSDLGNVARQLLKIERMFFQLNVEVKISYRFWRGILDGLLIICCSAGHFIVSGSTNLSYLAYCLTSHISTLHFFAFENLLMFFLDSIHHYLDMLVRRASSKEAVLVHLCTIHDRIADVIAGIQKVYGLSILFMAFSAFLCINCNILIAYKIPTNPVQPFFVCWIFIIFLMIFRISYACRRIKEKGNRFHRLLYILVKQDKSCRLINNIHISAHLLKKKSFSFNIAGFYEMDLKFISGMISSITTYAVILIQMGKNFN